VNTVLPFLTPRHIIYNAGNSHISGPPISPVIECKLSWGKRSVLSFLGKSRGRDEDRTDHNKSQYPGGFFVIHKELLSGVELFRLLLYRYDFHNKIPYS
jgi:hypothetical protein